MAQEGSDLITAVAYQDLDKVKNLVETGVDINYQEESAGATALIMSAMYNFGDIARYLIEKGADIRIKPVIRHLWQRLGVQKKCLIYW
jgi:ankyrin repeat protein